MRKNKTQVIRILLFFASSCMCFVQAQTVEEWVNKGLLADSLGKKSEAVSCFTKAIEQEPNIGTAWYNRGVVRMELKQYSLAVVDFNKCILLDTGNIDAYYNRATAYYQTYNYNFALADMDHFLSRYPNDYVALQLRARIAKELKEWNIAEKDLQKILHLLGLDYGIMRELVNVQIQQKKYAEAENLITSYIQNGEEEMRLQCYYDRAELRIYAEKYKESLEDCDFLLLQNPNNFAAQILKADNYFYLKDFDQAEILYGELYNKDTTNADMMADYGHCLLQLKKYSEAEQLLSKSIRLKGKNIAYAYLGRGLARFNLNHGQEACNDWQRSLMLGEAKANEYLHKYCDTGKQHNE